MRETLLCLVRHGETDWNRLDRRQGREDLPMNAIGRHQAELTGTYLSRSSWDGIVTSPLSRSHETATIIAEVTSVTLLQSLADLVERDYGAASGLTTEEVRARWPNGDIPGIEPLDELQRRAEAVLQSLVRRYPERRLIVVTHGGLINAMLAVLSKGEIGSGKTRLSNACLSYVSYSPPDWIIGEYNCVAHLVADAAQ